MANIQVDMVDTTVPKKFNLVALTPEPALLVAGTFGGPVVIGSLTPLRNATTLAAQDNYSSLLGIYRKVFSRGILRGWTGATTPAAAAAVQFTCLGPGYWFYLGILGSPSAAVMAGAVTETMITYGPTTRNAQLMHNAVAQDHARRVGVRPLRPVGPGWTALALRNLCANAGIRAISEPLCGFLPGEAGQTELGRLGADFLSSVFCGACSMPFNQMFSFIVTSPVALSASIPDRMKLSIGFLKKQYMVPSENGGVQLSRMVFRDAGLRGLYIGCMFASYAAVERLALSFVK